MMRATCEWPSLARARMARETDAARDHSGRPRFRRAARVAVTHRAGGRTRRALAAVPLHAGTRTGGASTGPVRRGAKCEPESGSGIVLVPAGAALRGRLV